MNKPRWAAAAAAAALLALAGCGSSGSTAPPSASPAATAPAAGSGDAAIPGVSTPANPVPLLRQAGATPAPGTVAGEHDAYGDRYAKGTIGDEDVRVYTAAGPAAYQANLATAWHPDDSQAVITVPDRNAVVILTAYLDPYKDGPQWAAGGTPAQVAARVGGQVVPAS